MIEKKQKIPAEEFKRLPVNIEIRDEAHRFDVLRGYVIVPDYGMKIFEGRQFDGEFIDITETGWLQLTETIIEIA